MNPNQSVRKVVIVGDHNVGKTCIIQRLIERRFNADTHPTIGSSTQTYHTTTTSGKPITMQIWDTAGQEQYQSLSQVYFRNSQAAIVVFDASIPNSVDKVVEWIHKYNEIVPNGFVAVVGNKSDKLRDLAEGKTQCLDIESEIDVPVSLVSALNGDGIDNLFKYVADNIVDTVQPTHAPIVPATGNSGCSC
ncbi:small GTP-binding protein [Tritrichomonas foetus]|uniref:Small GTP-binding protein n=1 Tax=Tritrichomonas foetus TaxID=1144522 RepID=A0A1J4KTB0_9EUKA|nr:small GTP-binding protein [Tritrichomonas foetus]|eukprot:OHT13028.1 small GTP-binding protein [Tritrichomonas foetus]